MRPDELSRTVDIFYKRHNPYVHRSFFDGDKRKTKPSDAKDKRKRPAEKERNRQFIADVGEDCAACQVAKLLNGHVADEAKLKRRNVLRDRMLFHTKIQARCAVVLLFYGVCCGKCNSTKRIRIVKSPVLSFHGSFIYDTIAS